MIRCLTGGYCSVGLLMLVAASAGCTSEFGDCTQARTCPSADADSGHSGESGTDPGAEAGAANAGAANAGAGSATGGAAGSGPGENEAGAASGDSGAASGGSEGGSDSGAACASDDDCNDGVHCNGVERCIDQVCLAGAQPCANEDPEHCSITCSEGASEPLCGIEGQDLDGDGYKDAACSQNPGEDCNDSAADGAEVHPGTQEICNAGVDDDCDGMSEGVDEFYLPGSDVVVAPAIGTTLREHPRISSLTGGGFAVAWADARSGSSQIYYTTVTAHGAVAVETLVTDDPAYENYDYPDMTGLGGGYRLVYRAEQVSNGDGVARYSDISVNGWVTSEGSIATGIGASGPQGSNSQTYVKMADDEVMSCMGNNCDALGPAPSYADTFHVDWSANHVAFEREGDLFLRAEGDASPTLVAEAVEENRTNPVVTRIGSEPILAYRYDGGMRVGDCEFSDAIPIDATSAGSSALVLAWDSERAKLLVLGASAGCEYTTRGIVTEEKEGTQIGSASIALEYSGMIGVVYSSKDTSSGEWQIKVRLIDPEDCQ
jgi:hypothetical protein